uniref:NADH-ubiquinone oxidoreductase chain 2 n=1 Tax=Pseudocellus pearsei TaxID=58148 RepID=A9LI85_9ARAC|nr:NADH dehydrogenase subunit 2 [Pseudocellus pearsei]ABS71904.1 NADH dehydrogenase subunit 2 [Pseudocellus pearsei]
MSLSIYSLILFNMMVMSVMMIISSSSWFLTWLSLEVNQMMFIGWSLKNKSHQPMMNYFLIQSIGSSLFIMSNSMSLMIPLNLNYTQFTYTMTSIAILIKIGSVPFHFWYPEVMNMMNWQQCMVLTTLQKLGPLYILFQIKSNITFFALSSTLIGSLSSINQTSLRKLLAFSSISHNGWMLLCISFYSSMWLLYFSIYSFINIITMNMMKKQNWTILNQLTTLNTTNKSLIILIFMSMSGLPPTLGFLPKWIILHLSINTSTFSSIILITSSLLMMFAYFNMLYITMFSTYNNQFMNKTKNYSILPLFMLLTLPTMPLMMI